MKSIRQKLACMISYFLILGLALAGSACSVDKLNQADAAMRTSLSAKLKVAREANEIMHDQEEAGAALTPQWVESWCIWSRRLMSTQLQLALSRGDRLTGIEAHMRRIKYIWKIVEARDAVAGIPFIATRTAEYFYREAEELLHQEQHPAD